MGANIVPATICAQCGDSRTDYCKLISFCNMEGDCAPSTEFVYGNKETEAEPSKTLLNVRIRTKGVCPGSDFQGEDTTVRIELDNITNPDDVKDQLLNQINDK